ncbi:hypothetical protein [Dyadobacter sp. OTU695]|uniref:hypothetical protein n=1 Tax=Dyadobacter sp. OTU695 TaxID=3043860 RepID=UPI00313E3B86
MDLRRASDPKEKRTARKVVEKKLTARDIAESIKRGLAEVKLIEEGKLKPKNIDDLLNEL